MAGLHEPRPDMRYAKVLSAHCDVTLTTRDVSLHRVLGVPMMNIFHDEHLHEESQQQKEQLASHHVSLHGY